MLRSYTRGRRVDDRQRELRHDRHLLCLDYLAADNRRLLWIAFVLLPLALVCDVLDGYVARLEPRRQSLLGADLDSLSDVISFGVAPAVLGFTLGLRGGWDMLCLTYFVVCGVSRLARFNVTAAALADTRDRQGEVLRGHADPDQHRHRRVARRSRSGSGGSTSDLWFGVLPLGPATLHPLALVYVASGSAMISATLRVPKP